VPRWYLVRQGALSPFRRFKSIIFNHNATSTFFTAFDNLPKSFPRDMQEDVRKIGKELIRRNCLLAGKHNYGLGISLNSKKLNKIVKIIKKIYPNFERK